MRIAKRGFGSNHFVRKVFLGTTAVALAVTSAVAGAANTDKFPRLGLISTGGPQKYAASFQAFAAKHAVVVINGAGETWQRNAGYSKQTVIQGIKAQSFANTKVFQYIGINTLYNSTYAAYNPFPTWYKQVNTRNWWLHPVTTTGTPVTDPQDAKKWLVDMAPQVPVDPATGLGPYAWAAKFVDDLFHLGRYAGTSAAPDLDGFFLDNILVDPSNGVCNCANGDWLRIGTTQAHNAPTTTAAVMAGERSFYTYLQSAWPGSQQLGNSGGTLGIAASNYYTATVNSQIMSATSPLSNVMAGGAIEHALGKSYSIEQWGGSLVLQKWVQTAMANYNGNKILIFSQGGVTTTGSDPLKISGATVTAWSPAWQGMRYGLTAALMNNGYYFADDGGYYDEETESKRRWFDEFDNAGRGVGYLGNPVATTAGAPQAVAWSNGVWKREFQGGVALWNPKGNGARTVNVSTLKSPSGHAGLKHIAGRQNPALNNGAAVSSVTLQDRDGVILLWAIP